MTATAVASCPCSPGEVFCAWPDAEIKLNRTSGVTILERRKFSELQALQPTVIHQRLSFSGNSVSISRPNLLYCGNCYVIVLCFNPPSILVIWTEHFSFQKCSMLQRGEELTSYWKFIGSPPWEVWLLVENH